MAKVKKKKTQTGVRRSRIPKKYSYMHNEYLLRSTNNYLTTFPFILLTNDLHDLKKKLVLMSNTSTLLINSAESTPKRSR